MNRNANKYLNIYINRSNTLLMKVGDAKLRKQ